jgi:hypothetical protein
LEVDKLSEKLMKVSSVANTARDDILRVSSIANAVNDDIFALTENAEVSKKTVARELAASRTAIEAIQSAQNGQQSSEASRPNSRVSVNVSVLEPRTMIFHLFYSSVASRVYRVVRTDNNLATHSF